jgi:hypothetical protein
MSKHQPQPDDYSKVAARMAAQMLASRAASRFLRQVLDCYIGTGWTSLDVWEAEHEPNPGYRVGLELHLDRPTSLATHRRRVLEIVKHATDKSPSIVDALDDGVRVVIQFPYDEGAAALAEMAACAAAGSLDRVH